MRLARALDSLERAFGPPPPPPARDAFALVLWENVAYLVDDAERAGAFAALEREIGLTPAAVATAPGSRLRRIVRGMRPEERVARIQAAARLAQERFGGELDSVLHRPFAEARRSLRAFPAIGEPGSEKILLFTGAHAVLALDSNALRVLLRLGYGREAKSYAASYRSAQEAASRELPRRAPALLRAHQILRRHGQQVCRRTAPHCGECPLTRTCVYFAAHPPAR